MPNPGTVGAGAQPPCRDADFLGLASNPVGPSPCGYLSLQAPLAGFSVSLIFSPGQLAGLNLPLSRGPLLWPTWGPGRRRVG